MWGSMHTTYDQIEPGQSDVVFGTTVPRARFDHDCENGVGPGRLFILPSADSDYTTSLLTQSVAPILLILLPCASRLTTSCGVETTFSTSGST
jgi:hypothetical protein